VAETFDRQFAALAIVGVAAVFSMMVPREAAAWSDAFDTSGCIEETGSMAESASPDWWVNSGGRFCRGSGSGATIEGSLPANDRWRTLYASSNPVDTDDGYHPQNIFRFVTKALWQDVQQTAYFRIRALDMSASSNRNASNGVLFFHRYQDGYNLYYAGIRVDGAAVIKKKINGTYYTMAYRSGVYPGGPYNASSNPNLIPTDRWIGLRTVIDGNASTVTIRLELDDSALGTGWTPIVEAEDSGQYGGPPITATGHAGIRTDFMDVEFQGYEALDVSSASATATPTATATPKPTATPPPPSPTPMPTRTPTPPAPVAPATNPTSTPVPNPTAAATATPVPKSTPTPPSQTGCVLDVSALNQVFGAKGGTATASVKCNSGCWWRATSSAPWLTIMSSTSGSGSGSGGFSYAAAANTTTQPRSATISVGGQTITVGQSTKGK
jgi:hypothetical protein